MKRIPASLILACLAACTPRSENLPDVVATSTWTAAYARAAGVEQIYTLAPAGMQHPSEYELQVDDIQKLKNTSLVICGGYEIIMEDIQSGLGVDVNNILRITTDYNLNHLINSIKQIAGKTGDSAMAEKNIKKIKTAFVLSRKRINKAGLDTSRVLVQFFMQTYAREMGLNIAGVFGPGNLEAFMIGDLMKKNFSLILDNAHNPSAAPLAESKKNVPTALLINFPGTGNTESIVDVIIYNTDRIIEQTGK